MTPPTNIKTLRTVYRYLAAVAPVALTFMNSVLLTHYSGAVAADWSYILRENFHLDIRTIDDQPLWAGLLHVFIGCLPFWVLFVLFAYRPARKTSIITPYILGWVCYHGVQIAYFMKSLEGEK